MPTMHINKSIIINAPADKIYRILNDFNHWQPWSPWLITEPDARVSIFDDGKSYEWEGKRVGVGNMKMIGERENESVDYNLNFLKPWKSHANVRFELKTEGDTTKVTWLMDSGLPFFLFWMKKMMTAFVEMDYERGLHMLKEYAEEGEVHSKLDFKGIEPYEGCTYIGIDTQCAIDDMGKRMKDDLEQIHAYMKGKEDLVDGTPFSIYHKWDVVKKKTAYTSGIPVKSIPGDLPDEFSKGEIPAMSVYTLSHTGSYHHLGNAWSALYTMQRAGEFKMNKKIHPFETYVSKPGEVPDQELITEIHFAVK